MDSPTKDRIDGGIDSVAGHAKGAAGDLTGDRTLQREGEADQMAGDAQRALADAKDKAGELKDKAGDALGNLLGRDR